MENTIDMKRHAALGLTLALADGSVMTYSTELQAE